MLGDGVFGELPPRVSRTTQFRVCSFCDELVAFQVLDLHQRSCRAKQLGTPAAAPKSAPARRPLPSSPATRQMKPPQLPEMLEKASTPPERMRFKPPAQPFKHMRLRKGGLAGHRSFTQETLSVGPPRLNRGLTASTLRLHESARTSSGSNRKSSRPRGSRRSTDLDGVPYVGSDVSVSSFGTRTPPTGAERDVAAVRSVQIQRWWRRTRAAKVDVEEETLEGSPSFIFEHDSGPTIQLPDGVASATSIPLLLATDPAFLRSLASYCAGAEDPEAVRLLRRAVEFQAAHDIAVLADPALQNELLSFLWGVGRPNESSTPSHRLSKKDQLEPPSQITQDVADVLVMVTCCHLDYHFRRSAYRDSATSSVAQLIERQAQAPSQSWLTELQTIGWYGLLCEMRLPEAWGADLLWRLWAHQRAQFVAYLQCLLWHCCPPHDMPPHADSHFNALWDVVQYIRDTHQPLGVHFPDLLPSLCVLAEDPHVGQHASDLLTLLLQEEEEVPYCSAGPLGVLQLPTPESATLALQRYTLQAQSSGALFLSETAKLDSLVPEAPDLCTTPTTMAHVETILQAYADGRPLLIESATGVGKSTLMEYCAAKAKAPLKRFVMSATVTALDFLGKLTLADRPLAVDEKRGIRGGQAGLFSFGLGPFAFAFYHGCWVFLDEFNLAPDAVLQCIEWALDNGVLHVPGNFTSDSAHSTPHGLALPMHPAFRLFAAQNPTTQQYAGRRFAHSASLLSRFTVASWAPMPTSELLAVVKHRLPGRDTTAVDLHTIFQRLSEANLPEPLPLTIRDLMRATAFLRHAEAAGTLDSESTALVVDLVFAEPFGTAAGRQAARDVIARVSPPPRQAASPFDALLRSVVVAEDCVFCGADVSTFSETDIPADRPLYIITPDLLALWHRLSLCEATATPVLLAGEAGCGKSEALRAYAAYRRHQSRGESPPLRAVLLTSETETSDLIGAMLPVRGGGAGAAPFRWVDGPVTEAFCRGHWLLLDNLEGPPAVVTERLNSVLEAPASLTVDEHEEMEPRRRGAAFWAMATAGLHGAALSPALLNRFAVLRMDPACTAGIARTYLLRLPRPLRALAASHLPTGPVSGQLQFLDAVARLADVRVPSEQDVFAVRCLVVQLKTLTLKYGPYLNVLLGLPPDAPPPWPPAQYTMTEPRREVAGRLSLAVLCHLPVILEGPAAVGKTHFTRLLAQYRTVPAAQVAAPQNETPSGPDAEDTEQPPGEAVNTLELVCNSASTTSADYFGSYLPFEGGCRFFYGPLARALRSGACFLADELNLAPPEVLTALQPVLEGRPTIAIPGTDLAVRRHPAFRFLATQNPATDYTGRKALPPCVLSRCVMLEVPPFDAEELVVIVAIKAVAFVPEAQAEEVARLIVQLLMPHNATLRTYIKLLGRCARGLHPLEWQQQVTLHAALLLPAAQRTGLEDLAVTQTSADTVSFRLFGLVCDVSGTLEASPLFRGGQSPPPAFLRSLALLAFALHFGSPESTLLYGPHSHKTLVVETLAAITGQPLHRLPLHPLVDGADLVGAVQPFNRSSLLLHVANHILASAEGQPQPHAQAPQLAAMLQRLQAAPQRPAGEGGAGRVVDPTKRSQAEAEVLAVCEAVAKDLADESLAALVKNVRLMPADQQEYYFVDGRVVQWVQRNAILLFENCDLPPTTAMERLNSLLEVNRVLHVPEDLKRTGNAAIPVHPRCRIVATVHAPVAGGLADVINPAVASRLTLIPVDVYPTEDADAALLACIAAEVGAREAREALRLIHRFEELLRDAGLRPSAACRLRWARYLRLPLPTVAERLALGCRVVVLGAAPPDNVGRLRAARWDTFDEIRAIDWMGLLFGPPDTADLEPIFDVSDATPTLRHCGLPLPPLLSSWSEPSLPSLVATPALVAALESIVAALHVGERVLLFGPPAAGKTALLRAVAALAGRPLFTVQCTEDLTYQDFYGGYAPVPGASGQQQFVWQAGDLVRALQDGALVALEDVHRLAPEALHALGPLLDAGPTSRVHPVGCPYPIHLSSPLLVATCTADEDRLPRLPDALWHRFASLRVPEPAERDVHLIATQYMETLGLSTTAAQQLCDVHLGLPAALPAAAATHGTVRSLLAAARLCRTVAAGEPGRPPPTSPAAVAAGIVYADSQPSLPLQDAARAYIASVCKATVGEVAGAVQITAAPPAVTAKQPFCQTAYSQRVLRRLALAVRSGAALVLEGPTCSGKTQLVQQLALQEGHPLVVIAAHASTEMTDLLGGPAPTVRFAGLAYDHDLHLVRRLIALLRPHVPSLKPLGEALLTITQPADEVAHILKHIRKGQFPAHVKTEAARLAKGRAGETTTGSMLRHRDGPLITAMRQGDWLLVDNLNLVSPGVLGLLLPLLEGARDTFHHPTCGDVAVHPDFRLLATCNSARGHPLPPAFLDRVLRVCLPPLDVAYLPAAAAAAAAAAAPAAADDGGAHAAELRRHAQAIVAAHVGPLADRLLAVHQDVLKQRLQVPEGYAYTFRNLLHTVRAIKSCLSPLAAVRACYTDASRGVTDRPTIDAILRRNQLASDVEAIRELWRSQGTVLEVLSASHLLAGTLKADLQVQPSKRLLQVCKAPLFRQAEVQEYERQEMGKTLIHLEAAIRRRGVPSDAAMFEVLYVYFGALLRSIRAAGFAIPPELEVVLLAPTSPRTFKPAVRGPAKTVPSAVLSSVAAAAIAAAQLAHRPNRSPPAKPPAPTPEMEPQPPEADEEDVPMAPPPNAKPAKAAASKKAAAPRSRWHQLRTNLRVFRRLTRREALLKAREVRQAGPGDSYGTLCAQSLFQSAVAQLSNAVYAALYNRAAAALPLMAGPPADLPPAVCVVVDNTPAPESVANQLVAALALVTHVLDALEVPCAVRRLYATQGSPFLEVKSTDKLMAEVNGQTLLDLCRPPLAGSELGPLSRPVALPARGVVALGQANEASLQRCAAAAGDLPCLKLLLPLDVVLFKPRDPLTVVLRDPVPADPDAPVSASQLFTLQAELTEALADFLFQAGVPDVGQTSVGLTFGTVSLPNALQEIGTLCTAAQELGHAAPARPPQTAGSGRAAPAPDAGPGAALLAALRPQLARDALRDAAAAVCPLPPTSMLERVEGLWANLEDVAAPLTAHLLEGLRHAAWPALEFTRSSPSLRGSRLSIRGLLRYFTSDGQYLKIWEQKDQGAVVRNAVCLVLDVSASMVPHFPAMLRGVVSCLAALAKAGVQHVGVVAFGDGLYVVKAPDEPWDSAAKHRLLATLAQARQRPPAGSPDAPALAVAVALLTQCPVIRPNDPKQVLVFTDGKGTSSPAFMRAVLASAHQSQVACTAVGLGDPAACCSVRYPAWVWGSDAAAVGPALQRWYSPGAAAPLPAAPYPPAAIAVPCVVWQAGTASVVSHVMAQRQSDGADRPGKLGVGPPLLRRDPHPGMGLAELLQLVGFTGAGYYVCPLCRRYTAAPDQHHAADHVGAAAPDATAYAPLALAELVEGLERFFLRYELLQYDMQTYGPIYVYTLETEVYDDMNRGLREARAAHSAAEPYKVVERYWPFIYRLEYALGQLPCQTGVVYRAIQHLIPMEVYPVGEFIVWQAFSSASRSEAAARFFLRGAGTVFIIHSRTAVAIPRFSSYPEEDEVLFRPYSTFYVRRHGTDSMRQFWAGDNPLTNVMVYELDEVQLSALERLADSLLQCILRFVDVPGWRQLSVVSHRVSALAMGQLLQRKAAQEALLQPPPTPPPAAADPAAAEPEAAPTVEAAAAAAELPQDKAALAARVAELETEVKQVTEELYSGLRPAVLQLQTINPMQIRELRTMAKPPPAVETIMLVLCEWLDEPRAVVFNVRPGFKHDWSSVMRMTSDPKFLQRLLKFDPDSLTGQRVAWTSGVLIEQTPPTVSMVAHRFRQWVDAHCRYHYNREVNQPKKERLKHLESQLQAAQQRLTELTAAPEPEPPPPPPEPSTTEVVTLDLEVKEGRDLVALDMFGERDPYVQLCWGMDSEPFYTTKVQRGTQPVWLEGVKGVQIPDGTRFISISVWDKNILKEEFMGMHQLPLEPPPAGDLWLKLRARENEPKDAKLGKKGDLGEIHINVKCHGAQRGSGEDMPTGDTPVAADPLALSQADPQDPEPAVQAEEPPRMQSLVTDHALDAEPPAEDFGAGVTVPVPPDPPPVSVPGTEDTVAPEGPVGKGLQSKAPKGKLELPDSEHTTDKTATPKSQEGKGPSKSPKGKLDRPPASPREGEHTMTPKAQKQGKGSTKAPKGKLDLPPEAPHQGEAEDAPTPKSQGSNPDRLFVEPKSRSASVEPTSAEATSTSGKPAKKSKASKKAMTTDKDASLASLGEVSFQEASHSQDPSSRKPSSVAPEEAEPVQMPAPKGKKNVGKKI